MASLRQRVWAMLGGQVAEAVGRVQRTAAARSRLKGMRRCVTHRPSALLLHLHVPAPMRSQEG